MYIPVVVPLAAKLMALRISVDGAALPAPGPSAGSAWSTGSVPTMTIGPPVTAGDHVVFVLSAVNSGPSSGKVQCGSGKTIALYELNWAVVIVDHSVAFFTVTAYPAASAMDFSVGVGPAGGNVVQ